MYPINLLNSVSYRDPRPSCVDALDIVVDPPFAILDLVFNNSTWLDQNSKKITTTTLDPSTIQVSSHLGHTLVPLLPHSDTDNPSSAGYKPGEKKTAG